MFSLDENPDGCMSKGRDVSNVMVSVVRSGSPAWLRNYSFFCSTSITSRKLPWDRCPHQLIFQCGLVLAVRCNRL